MRECRKSFLWQEIIVCEDALFPARPGRSEDPESLLVFFFFRPLPGIGRCTAFLSMDSVPAFNLRMICRVLPRDSAARRGEEGTNNQERDVFRHDSPQQQPASLLHFGP